MNKTLLIVMGLLIAGCTRAGDIGESSKKVSNPEKTVTSNINSTQTSNTEESASDSRKVVFEIADIEFVNPRDKRQTNLGEYIMSENDYSNIYLESSDRKSTHYLFNKSDFDKLTIRVIEANNGKGEDRKILYWAIDPFPVNGGKQIVFATNKDSILQTPQGVFSAHIINTDGTGEKVLVDGGKYGDIKIIDTTDDLMIASGGNRSLVIANVHTGETKQYFISGQIDAMSKDGSHVLFRKVKNDYTQSELFVINVHTGEIKKVGMATKDYYFSKG